MSGLFGPFLFLHVLGAIVALGPTFAFPLIGAMAGREPQHGNFATRITLLIDDRIVLPVMLSTAVTGAGMIWARSIPIFDPAYRWLLVSIVIYAIAMAFALLVQRPSMLRVIAMTGGTPALATAAAMAGSATGGPSAATGGPAAGGPPPGLAGATRRIGRNGLVLTGLSLAMVFLMVVKPSFGF